MHRKAMENHGTSMESGWITSFARCLSAPEMPFPCAGMGIHCNAHVNNLVVKPPNTGGHTFLAALDFDMAFTRANFMPEASYGQL